MLAYRSTFSTDAPVDRAVREIQAIMINWAEKKHRDALGPGGLDALEPGTLLQPSPDLQFILADDTAKSGDRLFGFVAIENLHDKPWTSQVMVASHPTLDGRALVGIELDAPVDHEDPARSMRAKVPNYVRSILEAFSCDDNGIMLAASPRTMGVDAVERLLEELSEEDQHGLALVAGTSHSLPLEKWAELIGRLVDGTVGQAAAYILDAEATEAFNSSVSARHEVRAGTVRTFVPGARFDDPADGARHRYITTEALADSQRLRRAASVLERRSRAFTNTRPLDGRTRRLISRLGIRLDEIALPVPPQQVGLGTPPSGLAVIPAEPSAPAAERSAPPVLAAPRSGRTVRRAAASATAVPEPAEAASGAVPVAQSATLAEAQARIEDLSAELADRYSAVEALKRRLAEAQQGRQGLEREKQISDRRAAAAEKENEALDGQVRALLQERDELQLDYAVAIEKKEEAVEAFDRSARQVDRLRRILERSGRAQEAWTVDEPERHALAAPTGWPELADWAENGTLKKVLPHLEFTCDWDAAVDLDDQNALSWIVTTWDVLKGLEDYARAKADEDLEVHSLFDYLKNPPDRYSGFPPSKYRPTESEGVENNSRFRRERMFPVPEGVDGRDADGRLYMDQHVAIAQAGMISPRLYLYDATDVAGCGKVIIGYIGRHLRNSQTN